MIPNHILDGLNSGQRIAILARGEQLDFLVHQAGESAGRLREVADRDGFDVLATHLKDRRAVLRFVTAREYEIGGEG
jgi:hypothetical protein